MTQRIKTAFRRRLASLPRAEDGAVAPLLGIMMIVLIGLMGIAIDTGRAMIVKARLVSALDAAGLAVGARTGTTDYSADALKFMNANFKTNYAGATVTNVTATPDATKTVITLAATATMPTAFMKLFGTSTVEVKANTEVTRAVTGLELAMVLDNTGSMDQSNSMPGLIAAANGLVDTLFAGKNTAEDLYIGLVPFSQAVNIGTNHSSWTDVKTATRAYYPATWTGCVEGRRFGYETNDDPPVVGDSYTTFRAYYYPDEGAGGNDWIKGSGSSAYTDIRYAGTTQRGPGASCPQPITLMTNVKSKIKAGINAMTASGQTFIDIGAIWGWRMLSPRWRGVWDGDMAANNLPLNYNTKNMTKAVVLMTDGENQFNGGVYTAYSFLSDGRLGSSDKTTAEGLLDMRLTNACNAMKANGIVVITVAYDNPDASTKALLQGCATKSTLYFEASNTAQLNKSFQDIGGALSSLRVSK